VREEGIHRTAFQTPDGLVEWVAMPSGLCNALATFQPMIIDTLRDFLQKFVTFYLDDVLAYIRTLNEHLQHSRLVHLRFSVLRKRD
jgi:hypothetical protein